MRVKTSITLPENLLREVDKILVYPRNRSKFFEMAIREYLARKKRTTRKKRDKRDLELINNSAAALNEEAEDILSFQVDI